MTETEAPAPVWGDLTPEQREALVGAAKALEDLTVAVMGSRSVAKLIEVRDKIAPGGWASRAVINARIRVLRGLD